MMALPSRKISPIVLGALLFLSGCNFGSSSSTKTPTGQVVATVGSREITRRELQAEINAIHARGEPLLISDYQQPQVPDAENAAIYLQQAMAAIANEVVIMPGFHHPNDEKARAILQGLFPTRREISSCVRPNSFESRA